MTAFERLFRKRGPPLAIRSEQWWLQFVSGSGYRIDPIRVGERWIKRQLDPDQETSEGPNHKSGGTSL